MKHPSLPGQVVLSLDAQNLILLVQTLRQTLVRCGRLQTLLLVGQNSVLCEKLEQLWATLSPGHSSQEVWAFRESARPLKRSFEDGLKIEAGLLILSSRLNLWIEFEACLTEPLVYQVKIHLDPHTIVNILQNDALAVSLAQYSGLEETDLQTDRDLLRQFWLRLLNLVADPPAPIPPPITQTSQPALSAPQPDLLDPVLRLAPMGIVCSALDGGILAANQVFCQQMDYQEFHLRRFDTRTISHPTDFAIEVKLVQSLFQTPFQPQTLKKRFLRRDGSFWQTEVTILRVGELGDETCHLLSYVRDLGDQQQVEQEIQQLRNREALLSELSAVIRINLDLKTIFRTVTQRLKEVLATDRVLAYQIAADDSGVCVAETVDAAYPTLLGQGYPAECIPPPYLDAYRLGRLWSVADVRDYSLAPCHREMLDQIQVRSMIAIAIMRTDEQGHHDPVDRQLWGLLVVHHCRAPRQWTQEEEQVIQAVANQMAIAIEQASLLQQLQKYAQELEERVRQRTASLEQSLRFEQLIRSLTETLLRALKEEQVLEAAVQGIVQTLNLEGCYAALFDDRQHQLQMCCEYFLNPDHVVRDWIPQLLDFQQWGSRCRKQVLAGQIVIQHFHSPFSSSQPVVICTCEGQAIPETPPAQVNMTQLIIPILDNQGILGVLFALYAPSRLPDPLEINLVEQVANQCAIAIRQARLYRQEHQQRVSAEYFRLFLEKSTDVFVEYDPELRYISINPSGSQVLNVPISEILGKTNRELLGSGAEPMESVIRQTLTIREPIFVDHEVPLPTGNRLFETVYTPILDPDGKVQRIISIGRDISEFRQQWQTLEHQNHELAETTRLKEEFIATTSHELRTPLTAILGFSNVLLQEFFGTLTSKQRDYIERIHSSGQHLLELINDILDLSRIEADRLELEPQLIFIEDICESVTSLIRERIEQQGLQFELEIEESLEYVVADPRRLRQMLLNLLTNAVKFTAQGTVGLKVYQTSRRGDGSPGAMIHFAVWDTGIGILEEDQRLLFSPFSQIDSSLARQHQGTGLGLVITRKLAELQGGTVEVISQFGKGSRFTLCLPLYKLPKDGTL
ncbi:MAG: ATP-binding protein [Leptolyngbyaceae cyanobacterium bins.59]|nr:ATP-binding protein [Leptolyngbyaceae cyanobacterium bins.59]